MSITMGKCCDWLYRQSNQEKEAVRVKIQMNSDPLLVAAFSTRSFRSLVMRGV